MNIIKEDFFHFIWENLHFNASGLKTTSGRSIFIFHPGYANNGDGPDYRFAKIRMGGLLFYGDVELHKKSSDWLHHGHQYDSRYERVILHVVAEDDRYPEEVKASDGNKIPTLDLRYSLPPSLTRIWKAFHRAVQLPCSGLIGEISETKQEKIFRHWDDIYFNHRLERMISLYPSEEPLSQGWKKMMVKGVFEALGYHKNQENMLMLSDMIFQSKKISKKVGLIEKGRVDESFISSLSEFLLMKSGLTGTENSPLKRTDWDFSASRPVNQPKVRIRQASELFFRLYEVPLEKWQKGPLFSIWENLCRLTCFSSPGKTRRDIIFHNVIIPGIYLLGQWLQYSKICREARHHWSKQQIPLPPRIKKIWMEGGIKRKKNLYRLAILHHFKYNCAFKRCNECKVFRCYAQT